MELTDQSRKNLLKIMIVQGASQRDVATAAGWKSHSYLGRLLRGEVKNLDNDAAVRIAHYLGLGVDTLFLSRSSSGMRHLEKQRSA